MVNSVNGAKAPLSQSAAKPAAAKAAEAKPAAPAGDTLSLSSASNGSEAGKTVTIDGKTYVLKDTEKTKRKWPLWEKLTTFIPTGALGLVGGYLGLAGASLASPMGAFTLGSAALVGGGLAVGAGLGLGLGRIGSWIGRKIAG